MRILALLLVLFGTCVAVQADDKSGGGIGQPFDKVKITNLDGKTLTLGEVRGQKATVVLFLSFECPISNGYIPGLLDLAKTCAKQDVALIGVCVSDEPVEKVRKWVAEFKVNFPIYHDPKQVSAHGLKAEVTPEAFVLDAKLTMRYRGRIDDLYNERFQKKARVTTHDLQDAIAAVVGGKEIKNPVTKAIGCPIPQEEKPGRKE